MAIKGTLQASAVAILMLLLAFASTSIEAHPAKDDPNWPHKGNTWGGPINAYDPANDGLVDLWDNYDTAGVNIPDGKPDGQYRDDLMKSSTNCEMVSLPGLLRQPVDHQSPGLIYFEWETDHNRFGDNTIYSFEEHSQGALAIPDCDIGYQSALTYQDMQMGPPLYPFVGGTYPNINAPHPCTQSVGPQWLLGARPDNNDDIGPVENGTVGDSGDSTVFQDDTLGMFDAVENLQTAFPTYIQEFSLLRYHINKDGVAGTSGNNNAGQGTLQSNASNPQYITGPPDGNWISPGHDGFVFAKFQSPVIDGPGPDIRVHEMEWADFGFYCLFGSTQMDGPYYLIGTSYGAGVEDYDLAHYYNAPGAQEKGGPQVAYIGIVTSTVNMHRMTADFYWTPNVQPTGHPYKDPVAPVRNETIQFFDTSTRHGHPTWQVKAGIMDYRGPNPTNEDEDPITSQRWTFIDHLGNGACNGPYTYSPDCFNPKQLHKKYPGKFPPVKKETINTSWAKNPKHYYPEPGVYEVCHSVVTEGQYDIIPGSQPPKKSIGLGAGFGPAQGVGNFTDTVCKWVDVWNYDPIVDFTFAKVAGCVPNTWVFDGTYTDEEEDDIVAWEWTFSDGTVATGQKVTHQFPDDGYYNITLRITDEYGGFDEMRDTIGTFTNQNLPPVLVSIADRYLPVGTGVEFAIIGHDSECDTLDYNWFGLPPGAVQIGSSPIRFSWIPEAPGVYDLFTYSVTDGEYTVEDNAVFIVYELVSDLDDDGGSNLGDNCPGVANHNQIDTDGDGIGDLCDEPNILVTIDGEILNPESDLDRDGIVDRADNCPLTPNRDQFDLDIDGFGDMCDADLDGDGVPQFSSTPGALLDNCAYHANSDQTDADGNGQGDLCDQAFQDKLAADAARGCPGPFCTDTEETIHANAAESAPTKTGVFGFSNGALFVGAALVLALLGGTWLVTEGIRGGKLARK